MTKNDARQMLDHVYIRDLLPEHIEDLNAMQEDGASLQEVAEFHVDWLAEMLSDEEEMDES